MTIFHSQDRVKDIQCLKDQNKYCAGTACMAWMYRQYDEKLPSGKEGDSQTVRTTDTSRGICGWLYVMAYFRDKNSNPSL